MSGRRSIRSSLAAATTAALLAGGMAAFASPATAAPSPSALVPTGVSASSTLTAGRYVVTLAEDPAATYDGGAAGMAATAPEEGRQLNAAAAPVEQYSDYLTEKQDELAGDFGATTVYNYTLSINAFAADLSAEQAAELRADKRVAALTPDETRHVTAAEKSTDFIGLSGDDGLWAELGGVEEAGAGVVVGVLDTGIAPENPSFAGEPLAKSAGAAPYTSGGQTFFRKSDGTLFQGLCQRGESGQQFDGDECNSKIISARYYVEGRGTANNGGVDVGEYLSPRDGDGHGSHTAGTAAGNPDVATAVGGIDQGAITGVAPAAKISSYKVCWSGPDPAVTTDDGCNTTDMLAAIDQAVRDGVDVINFSIGGGAATTTVSPTDIAFLGAAEAGVFVSASAGNDGPDPSTLDNAAPWITTVAASTFPSPEGTVTFPGAGESGADLKIAGATITVSEDVAGDLAWAGDLGDPLCQLGEIPAGSAAGEILVCQRGTNPRVEKSEVAKTAGAIGMILVNAAPGGSIDTDTHSVPTVHIDGGQYARVVELAQTAGQTATLSPGNSAGASPAVPQLAGFSSHGPVLADGSDILKPDIAAPGVSVLAAAENAEGAEPTFEYLSGTSMAAPHVAGLAALYFGEQPTASTSEVKSAIMTTAGDLVDAEGAPYTDPFGQGAGQIDPSRMFEPGLVYLNGADDWASYIEGIGYEWSDEAEPVDPSQLNLASIAIGELTAAETITRTVTARTAGTYTASLAGLEGIDVTVEPESVTLAEGESASYTVTFDRTDATLDAFATGYLTWSSGDLTVRSPIAVQPVAIVAPAGVEGTGVTGSVEVEVTPGSSDPIPLGSTGLSKGEAVDGSGTVAGEDTEYPVTVPAGAAWARFDLDSAVDTPDTDLDLTVLQLDAAGTPVAQYVSATGSADERVDIPNPEAGAYVAVVDVFAAPGTAEWTFTSTSVVPGAAPVTFEPPTIAATQGEPTTFTASWTGLEAFSSYLGLIQYGETGRFTALSVTTQEGAEPTAPVNLTPPTISGTPRVGETLTADPGTWDTEGLDFALQWQRDGVDIPGATAATYVVTPDDAGAELTGVVTASLDGGPTTVATSAPVVVLLESVTTVKLNRQIGFSWQRVTAQVAVTAGDTAATGNVQVTVDGKPAGQPVVLAADGTAAVKLPRLGSGVHQVRAEFVGSDTTVGSSSPSVWLWIIF